MNGKKIFKKRLEKSNNFLINQIKSISNGNNTQRSNEFLIISKLAHLHTVLFLYEVENVMRFSIFHFSQIQNIHIYLFWFMIKTANVMKITFFFICLFHSQCSLKHCNLVTYIMAQNPCFVFFSLIFVFVLSSNA